jgi:AcrR family transcriptional regulator
LHLTIRIVNIVPVTPAGTATRRYGGISGPARVAARRARLVEAAVELYGSRGYTATGVKDVCLQAGVTDRYFYESFKNGADLFAAAFDHVASELFTQIAVSVAQVPASPEDQARAAIETFVRTLADDPRKPRLLFVEPASVGKGVEKHVRASIRRFVHLVSATARPHVPDNIPDRMLAMGALSLVGAIQLILIEWLDGSLDATVDDIVDYLVDMFLVAGAATAPGPSRPRGH